MIRYLRNTELDATAQRTAAGSDSGDESRITKTRSDRMRFSKAASERWRRRTGCSRKPWTFSICRKEPESIRAEYGTTPFRQQLPAGAAAGRAGRAVRARLLRAGAALGRSQRHQQETARTVPRYGPGVGCLIRDLKRRGLLDETLVVWGGEFGRTPVSENGDGRDHNPYGFTMWMAGGGVKGGLAYGATDEFGFKAVENRVSIHDLHATIL